MNNLTRLESIYHDIRCLIIIVIGILLMSSCTDQDDLPKLQDPIAVDGDNDDYITLNFSFDPNSILRQTRASDFDYNISYNGTYLSYEFDSFRDADGSPHMLRLQFPSSVFVGMTDENNQQYNQWVNLEYDNVWNEFKTVYFSQTFSRKLDPSKILVRLTDGGAVGFTGTISDSNNIYANPFDDRFFLSNTNDWSRTKTDLEYRNHLSYIFIVTDEFENNLHDYEPLLFSGARFDCYPFYDSRSVSRSIEDIMSVVKSGASFNFKGTGYSYLIQDYKTSKDLYDYIITNKGHIGIEFNYQNSDYLKDYLSSIGQTYYGNSFTSRLPTYNGNDCFVQPLIYISDGSGVKISDGSDYYNYSAPIKQSDIGKSINTIRLYCLPDNPYSSYSSDYYNWNDLSNGGFDLPYYYATISMPSGGFKPNTIYIIKNRPGTCIFSRGQKHWSTADTRSSESDSSKNSDVAFDDVILSPDDMIIEEFKM